MIITQAVPRDGESLNDMYARLEVEYEVDIKRDEIDAKLEESFGVFYEAVNDFNDAHYRYNKDLRGKGKRLRAYNMTIKLAEAGANLLKARVERDAALEAVPFVDHVEQVPAAHSF
jgi:hypothetical protein